MCIIIFKPKGEDMVSDSIIKNCMDNNPDGAGYMFNIPGQSVYIRKGFWDHEDLITQLRHDVEKNTGKDFKDISVAIHARIATAGLTKDENCHPFPVSHKVGLLQSTNLICNTAVMHNGMISISDDKSKNLSDTQIFIRDVLSRVDLSKNSIRKLIEMSIGSGKLIFFDKFGMFRSFGKWVEDNNIFYSNDTYKERTYTYSKYNWHNYKWDDEDTLLTPASKASSCLDKKTFSYSDFKCCYCGETKKYYHKAYPTEENKLYLFIGDDEHICNDCYAMSMR